MRMVSAYSMMANGGRQIKPSLIDRIQDRYGKTVFKHDERGCEGCVADRWKDQPEPELIDNRRAGARPDDRLPDHLDDGRRRPARHRRRPSQNSTVRSPARPARPTTRRTPGSSASRRTSWSASILASTSRSALGKGTTGGGLAAPIFKEFMAEALDGTPPCRFQVPEGMTADRHQPQDRHARRRRRGEARSSKPSSQAPARPTATG